MAMKLSPTTLAALEGKMFRFERIQLLLKDGVFRVLLDGGDLISAEVVTLHCGNSLDLTLPIGGKVPVKVDIL